MIIFSIASLQSEGKYHHYIASIITRFAVHKNVPQGRGYHYIPFLSYLLFRALIALSAWGDRAEHGFHFQFSISEEARPAGMRFAYRRGMPLQKKK